MAYLIVFIAGGIFFTIGFSSTAQLLDKGVAAIKIQTQELVQELAKETANKPGHQ